MATFIQEKMPRVNPKDAESSLKNLYKYVESLNEQLAYLFGNLGGDNFNQQDMNNFIANLSATNIITQTIVSNAVVTKSLYAERGDIAQLTVDWLSTSKKVMKFLANDTTNDDYIEIHEQGIELKSASVVMSGGAPLTEILNDRYGNPLYWQKDIAYAEIVDGFPYVNGKQVYMDTEVTDYPVRVYRYDVTTKMLIDFDAVNGVNVPKITMGNVTITDSDITINGVSLKDVAEGGGDVDIPDGSIGLSKLAPEVPAAFAPAAYGSGTKQDGEKMSFIDVGGNTGWYRIATARYIGASAIVTINHEWANGGNTDMALLVSCLAPIVCLKNIGASSSNPSILSNARVVNMGDGTYALDVYSRAAVRNHWKINIVNTGAYFAPSMDLGRFVLQAPTFVASDDTLPDGQRAEYPMEWLNPPMQPGVEYRTTERHQGKPVYVKLVDVGSLPNNSYVSVNITTKSDGTVDETIRSISAYGCTGGGFGIPAQAYGRDPSKQILLQPYLWLLFFGTNFDASADTACIFVKYTKITD